MSKGETHRVSKHVERRTDADLARRRSKAARDQESRAKGSQKGCLRSGEANRTPPPITLPRAPWEDRDG